MSGAAKQSRAWRKFLKHKPALISAVVIFIYLLIAFAVIFGNLVTIDDCDRRIGPKDLPGFGWKQEPERQRQSIEWFVEQIEQPLARAEKKAARNDGRDASKAEEDFRRDLQSVEFGRMAAKELSIAQARILVDDAWEAVDQLDEYEDMNQESADDSEAATAIQSSLDAAYAKATGLYSSLDNSQSFRRSINLCLGTDRQGRSIFLRSIYSIRVAILVGVVTGVIAVTIGTILGLMAGYFGGWIDGLVTWLYSTFASIPNIVLLMLLAIMFRGGEIDVWINAWTGGALTKLIGGRLDETLIPVFVAFSATFWIGPCRVIRGETMKLRESEYVQAAQVMGYSRTRILLRHVLPNISHLMLINFSLLFIGAIKSEVILSFLGIGVQKGASWGLMINSARDEVLVGFFWQIGSATALMFGLVLAFNILSDALQDILDPKHV